MHCATQLVVLYHSSVREFPGRVIDVGVREVALIRTQHSSGGRKGLPTYRYMDMLACSHGQVATCAYHYNRRLFIKHLISSLFVLICVISEQYFMNNN